MASHGDVRNTGPDTIEALTADREKMWANFTAATTGTIILMVVLLVGMAVFLL
jgi:hypothetical protein